MKLNVQERLGLLELLPREGEYAALKEIRKARDCIALTPEEIKLFEYREAPAPSGHGVSITWNPNKEKEVDIPLDVYITTVIINLLSQKEKEKKLTEQAVSLYEKFVVKQ